MDFTVDSSLALLTLWGLRLLSAILIMIAGWVVGNWASRSIEKVRRLDETLKTFLAGFVKYAILAVAFITLLGQFGVQTASLLAVLGAIGLAIGLALQGTLSNVAAGVMLLILRPFKVGDYIQFGSIGGTVKTLGLFGCELSSADNVYIFAPNGSIWNAEILNYTRNQHRRLDIAVGISYEDDINKAFRVIQEIFDKENRLIRADDKKPQVMVNLLADFSVNLIVRVWVPTAEYWNVRFDLTKAVKEALEREGITIPFPTQTVHMVQDKAG